MVKERIKFVISNEEVNYYIICTDDQGGITYGIYAEAEREKADYSSVENIFFTEKEALMRCKWLCKNNVYPVALLDTLRNMV